MRRWKLDKILHSRGIIKSVRGTENQTIPLPSILKYQYLRADYLSNYLTNESFEEDPAKFGWIFVDGSYEIVLQNEDDPYFSLPKQMMWMFWRMLSEMQM